MHDAGVETDACSLLVQEEVRLEVDLISFAVELVSLHRAAVQTAGAAARRVMRAHIHRVCGAQPSPQIDDHLLGSERQ